MLGHEMGRRYPALGPPPLTEHADPAEPECDIFEESCSRACLMPLLPSFLSDVSRGLFMYSTFSLLHLQLPSASWSSHSSPAVESHFGLRRGHSFKSSESLLITLSF
eukprot:3600944-Pyramimonas_sp.AAC.2